MKRHVSLGIILLMFTVAGVAQSASDQGTKGSSGAEQTLKDLENRWVNALVKADVATLESILADGYVETDESGGVNDRQSGVAAIKLGDVKFTSIKLEDMKVHQFGETAVVTGAATQHGTYKGNPLAQKIRFTDTFVKQKGKWKAVASHLSAV